jgi:putative transcriptional regulator
MAAIGFEPMQTALSSLAPSLLVAMPQLQDPNFSRAVVLLCEHQDGGAMGLVINRTTETKVADILDLDPPTVANHDLSVCIGGPVDPIRGWLLLSENLGDGIQVAPGLYLSASREILRQLLGKRDLPCRCRFLVGYAGWGPKQLDRELAASAWLTVPVSSEILFDTPSEHIWEVSIRQLGIDPNALAMGPGVH